MALRIFFRNLLLIRVLHSGEKGSAIEGMFEQRFSARSLRHRMGLAWPLPIIWRFPMLARIVQPSPALGRKRGRS